MDADDQAGLPYIDMCYVGLRDGEIFGYVYARAADERPEATRRFEIGKFLDADGDETDDPTEVRTVIFGGDLGFVVYEVGAASETLQ